MPITNKASSVFDFLAPADREKLASLTGKFIPSNAPVTSEQQQEQQRKIQKEQKNLEEQKR